jgi:lysophospholipase L1-like esterase
MGMKRKPAASEIRQSWLRPASWLGVALCLFAAGCATQSIPPVETGKPSSPVRFLALGDSYTIGEGVGEHERWPVQLARQLREEGLAIEDPLIIARTGWTTGELLAALQREQPSGSFGLVSLLIGVNNQYRGLDLEAYRQDLIELLHRAIDLAGGDASRVLVLSIPDWGVTPFAAGRDRARIAEEIDAFNAVNRDETEALGSRYVDVTATSRQAATEPAFLAADGLHPSGEMYSAWVRLVRPEALAALADSP